MNKKIVVVGSSNTDMVVKTNVFPKPGETVIGESFMMNQGGKGANQAVAAARMGGDVTFISKVGSDFLGAKSIELYEKEEINTDYISVDEVSLSGVAFITIDSKGENSIIVAPGANASLMKADIDKALHVIENADLILMQCEIPIKTVEYVVDIAHEKGVKVILNPAPAQVLSDELIRKLYLIVPNEIEAEVLSGVKILDWDTAKKAAESLCLRGVDNVIITLGSMGALVKQGDSYTEVPAIKVKAVDTTAAGDTFCGALTVALATGKSMIEAVRIANKCSSISVTRMGAQNSIPYKEELV